MLGLDNAGKTCAAKSLVGDAAAIGSVAPTIGFSKVETKYKGFQVLIYDLGGSKGFRSIWSHYYHEVHGFIFVVDSTESERLSEAKDALKEFLRSDKVRGKPVLLLCNKTDVESAEEMDVVVDALNLERFVNEARCPTRVDRTVANKSEGLKDGFKWLAKSVIANLADLGPRVDADIEAQSRAEARKREELRKRIEERKRLEEVAEDIEDREEAETANRGFVALSEIRDQWAEKENAKHKKKAKSVRNGVVLSAPALYDEPERTNALEKLPKIYEEGNHRRHRQSRDYNSQQKSMKEEPLRNGSPPPVIEKRSSVPPSAPPPPQPATSNGAAPRGLPSLIPDFSSHVAAPAASSAASSLELEPVSQPRKKRSLLKRLNSRTSPMKTTTTVPMTPVVRSAYRAGSLGSSKSVSSAESLRDSQVIKAYS